jgi:hypothetical protein
VSEHFTKDSDAEEDYGEAKKKAMVIGGKVKGNDGAKIEHAKGRRRRMSSL